MGLAASPAPASNRDQNVKLNTIGINPSYKFGTSPAAQRCW
jgi:hypothetical protein